MGTWENKDPPPLALALLCALGQEEHFCEDKAADISSIFSIRKRLRYKAGPAIQ